MKALILIVEDNKDLLELLEHRLREEDYDTLGFLNTKHMKTALEEEDVDLIIMDRTLPDIEGSEYIALLRAKGINIPVIFISAKNTSTDIEEGFLRGGDDYITKPFEVKEFLLRVEAVLRRTKKGMDKRIIAFKDIILDLDLRTASIKRKEIDLTKLEFNLLQVFVENQHTILDRDFLLEHAWGKGKTQKGRTVNVAIKRLKEKLNLANHGDYIKTVRGVGYTLQ